MTQQLQRGSRRRLPGRGAARCACLLAAAALPAGLAAGPALAARKASSGASTVKPAQNSPGSKAIGVKYTPATVVVPTRVVKANLQSVSKNGATYTFSPDSGPLRKLKKGSVMLLQGVAVRDVTKVTKRGSRLVVKTTPAAITDLVRSGTLKWSTPVNFANAYAIGGSAVPVIAAADMSDRDAILSRFGLHALAGKKSFTLKGKTHSYKYSATFRSEGKAVGVDITISKSSGVDMSVTLSGTLDNLSSGGSIRVRNQHLSSAKLAANNLTGEFKVSYEVKPLSQLGLGKAGGIVITIPAELTFPFAVGGVPFFLGIGTTFDASVGFSKFDQSVKGSYTIKYDGKGGFSTQSSGTTTPAGALQGLGKIILDAADAVRNGPLTVLFGATVPQLELGLGVKGLNVAGSVRLIAQTGVELKGSGCDTRGLEVAGFAGAEANFFGFSTSLGSAQLFQKQYSASYPRGCGTFDGFS